MELLAYLHLAQAYECPETQEFVLPLSASIAPAHFKHLGKAAASLFSVVSATWMLAAPAVVLAEEAYPSKQFVPVILGDKYVQSYAGGSYYYILQDGEFDDRPAYAVAESSYHSVRPEPAPVHSLCGVFGPGDSGSGVACLQELLQKAGYFDGVATGYFGPKTCDAVIAFQRDYGLYVDGVAGPQTLEALNQVAGST